ncbi:hypothetical protein PS627_04028 [Pseudomonas fluorescens]|uniref:hypothetical protein n=1 Tax=Pseudomonas fluorescens TaxID=294 RepID=UPI001250E52D|nr:hypothetical protein [Pseudomonas fluorescens]CAG8870528.1 hypothetical protein PS627_04028 [Pseudomonas fluorescens]
MDQGSTPDAESKTSKMDSEVIVHHQSAQCYFRPDTEEFVFVADDEAGNFETHWREMLTSMDAFHTARARYCSALEMYAQGMQPGFQSPAAGREEDPVEAAERELEANRAALQNKLGDFSQTKMRYDDVIELLPVAGQGGNRKGRGKSPGLVYVKKGYFSKTEQGRKLHAVSLKSGDKKGGAESIIRKNKHGNTRIDPQKLAQQLTDLQWPKIKVELKDILKWTGSDFDPETLKADGVLFDWAERWNESLDYHEEFGAHVDVSAGAQFMRYASNVGGRAELDPNKGTASLISHGSASFTVASATLGTTIYVPNRLGCSFSYTDRRGGVFDLGMFRLVMSPELTGFIGASVIVEEQMQVVVKGEKQFLAGQSGGRLPRFRETRTRGAVFHQQMAEEDEGLRLTGAVEIGGRLEGSLKGSLQWLKPAEPMDARNGIVSVPTAPGKFTDLCSVSASIGGLGGLALGGKFYCAFINGKFCFHVAASICWGVGAKGGIIFEVGTDKILEFGSWLVYQLYLLNYRYFDVVREDSFLAYGKYCVLQMLDLELDIYKRYAGWRGGTKIITEAFDFFLEEVIDENRRSLGSSKRRNKLAKNLVNNPLKLLNFTPEAKGITIYTLTRYDSWDILDSENRGSGLILDFYQLRKEAVTLVLKSIQTRAEWRKIFCRITASGESMASEDSEVDVIQLQERYLVDFLRMGFNRDQDLHRAKQELVAIFERLKSEPASGFALTMNDAIYYKLNYKSHPYYLGSGSLA